MSYCSKISASIGIDCDNPLNAKVGDILYLINYSDISKIKYASNDITENINTDQHRVIQRIYLGNNARMYKVEGHDMSNDPGEYFVNTRYGRMFFHKINFMVFRGDSDSKETIDKISRGRFVAIIDTKRNVTNRFFVYGIGSGLIVKELERVVSEIDNGGSYKLMLETHDERVEPHLPNILFNTSLTQTITDINNLLNFDWILANSEWDDLGIWVDGANWSN